MSKESRRPHRRQRPPRDRRRRLSPALAAATDEFLESLGDLREPYMEGLRIAMPYADALGENGCPDAEIGRFLIFVGTYGLAALTTGDPEDCVFFATPSCGDEMCMTPKHQVLTSDENEAVLSPRRQVFMKDVIWIGSGKEIPDGFEVGHLDGNAFDCRDENLVLVPIEDGLHGPPEGPFTIMEPEDCAGFPSYPVPRSVVLAWEASS